MGAVRDLFHACVKVNESAALSYIRELGQSASDFQIGVEAMKRRSTVLFGANLKRCRPKPLSVKQPVIVDPFANPCGGLW
jgi:hypothetical protein